MHMVVSYAPEWVHPASAGIDDSARDNERSVADTALEGMVAPFPCPTGWHNQARPADVPVVSRFLSRFKGLVNTGINRIVELIPGHAGRDDAYACESS